MFNFRSWRKCNVFCTSNEFLHSLSIDFASQTFTIKPITEKKMLYVMYSILVLLWLKITKQELIFYDIEYIKITVLVLDISFISICIYFVNYHEFVLLSKCFYLKNIELKVRSSIFK